MHHTNLSNGKCHLCQTQNAIQNIETLQHLFFHCNVTKLIINELNTILKNSNMLIDTNINEINMILGFFGGSENDFVLNTVIFYSKWELWKIRNKIKYDKVRLQNAYILDIWKKNVKKSLTSLLGNKRNKTINKHILQNIIDIMN